MQEIITRENGLACRCPRAHALTGATATGASSSPARTRSTTRRGETLRIYTGGAFDWWGAKRTDYKVETAWPAGGAFGMGSAAQEEVVRSRHEQLYRWLNWEIVRRATRS
jgi:hypothetical protein